MRRGGEDVVHYNRENDEVAISELLAVNARVMLGAAEAVLAEGTVEVLVP